MTLVPEGPQQLHHHVLAPQRSSSRAAAQSLEFSTEKAQHAQFSYLLGSICHHLSHAFDLIPGKGYWLKLKKDDIEMKIVPSRFFYK